MTSAVALIAQLDDPSELGRRIAVADLVELKATTPLIDALNDQRARVRGGAANAIGQLSTLKECETALPLLVKLLGDSTEFVQDCASDALTKFGAVAEPLLIEALTDSANPLTKAFAAKALARIGGHQSRETITLLISLLAHEHSFVRRQCALALQKVVSDPVDLFVQLIRWTIENRAAPYLPFVRELALTLEELGDTSDKVRKTVAFAVATSAREGRERHEAIMSVAGQCNLTVGDWQELMAGRYPGE